MVVVLAAALPAVHSASVCGLISSVPCAVMMVLTDSQIASAFGSTTACIRSFVSATGLNGGGWAPQPFKPIDATTSTTAMLAREVRLAGRVGLAGPVRFTVLPENKILL